MNADKLAQHVNDTLGTDKTRRVDGQISPRVLIHHGQAFQLLTV